MQNYRKASALPEMTDEVIRVSEEVGAQIPSVEMAVHFYPIDGAVNRVGPEATAFPHRNVRFQPVIAGMWADRSQNEANIRWVRDYWSALRPHSAAGGYVNFMAADDQGRIEDYRGTYDKLATVKKRYDPKNLFHINQNIEPR